MRDSLGNNTEPPSETNSIREHTAMNRRYGIVVLQILFKDLRSSVNYFKILYPVLNFRWVIKIQKKKTNKSL